jgi:hypothetical protein
LGDDGGLFRTLTEEDFRVLNTIRELTAGLPNSAKDWDAVADRLLTGYRSDKFPAQAATVNSGVVPLVQALKTAESEARAENSELRVQELLEAVETLQERVETLSQEKYYGNWLPHRNN